MSRKTAPDNPPPQPPAGAPAGVPVPVVLRWGTIRTALSIFAVGWIFFQVASAVLLGIEGHSSELEFPVLAVLVSFFSWVLRVGEVFFITGMCMTCRVPRESEGRPITWCILGSLILSAVAGLLLVFGSNQDQETELLRRSTIEKRFKSFIEAQSKSGTKAPPNNNAWKAALAKIQKDVGEELPLPWGPDLLRALVLTFIVALAFAKLLFSAFLWRLARHLRQEALAGGLLIYLLGEAFGLSGGLSILFRQPAGMGPLNPFLLFNGNWYAVGITSAFCVWFLVNLFLVRRAISRSLTQPARAV